MKRTYILPNIYKSSPNQLNTEGNLNQRFNTHCFSLMLRKFQIKKLAPIKNKSLSSNRYQTDPNELQEMDKEEKKENIKNEKSIIKIYQSNSSEILQKIKDETNNSIHIQLIIYMILLNLKTQIT